MARLDVWLWSVRLFKTRSLATDACKGGHIRVNDKPVKPAQQLKVGDRVTWRQPGWVREFEVTQLLTKRVGAPVAVTCYVDHSPERPAHLSAAVARRDRGAGRPTKKDRRALDRLRGRDAFGSFAE
ncbi:MAG: RNA-binding S4 domain-containing protein [Propionibacteriaceae bacterium]|nr:RNA-binding S4 domain-containing protein [Propionibacteriaceae bacterium]